MTQYAMVIDLKKCTGCGACALACKTENNTAMRRNGQTHNWADYQYETSGKFPDTKFVARPVLCNHCSNAPCVEACPVSPKAMFKTDDGITMHNNERCIGCRACQNACPYSEKEAAIGETSVISYNDPKGPYEPFWANTESVIPAVTMSGKELAHRTDHPPHRTSYEHPDYEDVRRSGIVEKCIFCEHRIKNGKLPYCVVSCPAKARIFGDLSNPASEVAQLVKKHEGTVLKPEAGTKPNVYYIRSYGV